jgi:hypothetical protein
MNIGDVVVHTAEPLYILAKGLTIPLGYHMQVTSFTRELVATMVSTNEAMAQI